MGIFMAITILFIRGLARYGLMASGGVRIGLYSIRSPR